MQELRMGEAVEQVFPTTSSQPPQSSMTRFVNVIKRLPVQKSRTIDVQLLKIICKKYHPFLLVEDKEFVRFVELLNPSFTLPSRKT